MVRRTMSYALVALSLPLRQSFTYRVPEALEAEARPGAMVEVPLRGRSVRGVVLARVHRVLPAGDHRPSRRHEAGLRLQLRVRR